MATEQGALSAADWAIWEEYQRRRDVFLAQASLYDAATSEIVTERGILEDPVFRRCYLQLAADYGRAQARLDAWRRQYPWLGGRR